MRAFMITFTLATLTLALNAPEDEVTEPGSALACLGSDVSAIDSL